MWIKENPNSISSAISNNRSHKKHKYMIHSLMYKEIKQLFNFESI